MIKDKTPHRTQLSDLGELGLIDRLTAGFEAKQPSTLKSVGDDAAVIDFKDKKVVISTDLPIEGVHLDLSYVSLKHLGYKAISVNVSDIYAVNARATQITVSIVVSNRFPLEALEELYVGIHLACKRYEVDLVGGDTTSSTRRFIILVTAIGEADEQELVYRNGVKENDPIVLTGDIGGAYIGLQILEHEKAVFQVNPNSQPDIEMYSYILERQLKPEARKDIPPLLKELGVEPAVMVDVSDGLSSEVLHIRTQSGVGCRLYEDKILLDPQVISTCEESNLDSVTIALSGGKDCELLFTIKQADYDKIEGNPHFNITGYITNKSEGVNLITHSGQSIPIIARGWNALTNN